MRVVFMGTPKFAIPSLEVLYERGDEVVLVISQPDRPKGRGKKVEKTPVKYKAEEWGMPVYQPQTIRSEEVIEKIRSLKPDLIVVTAYGQVLPKEILEIPLYGCINVHASLLPKYRGAAPIQFALLNREKKTGITTMMMDEHLDTGDMLVKEEVDISKDETIASLMEKLSIAGKKALSKTLKQIDEKGKDILREKQNEENSTYAPMLTRDMGIILWEKSAEEIKWLIRAVEGWPSATTYYGQDKVKLFEVETTGESSGGAVPGTIVKVLGDCLIVATGDELVKIKELQFPNKKRMKIADYLRGNIIEEGSLFTSDIV